MQTTKHLSRALTVGLALLVWSCGGGGGDDPDDPTPVPPPVLTGKHYTKTCNLDARASETTVALTGLTSEITRSTGSASWLTANIVPYTSGTPQVKVAATENSQNGQRQQELTFYAASDTLVLTVQQAAFNSGGGSDTDQPFDTPTDQPGYGRQR